MIFLGLAPFLIPPKNFENGETMNEIVTPKWILKVLVGFITTTVLLLMTCAPAHSQVRITGAFGISQSVVGQAQISYQFKKLEPGIDMIHDFNHRTYFGVNMGPALKVNEDLIIKPFAGLYYKLTGNKSSRDRYLHDGTETVFTKDMETNSGAAAVGLQIIRQHLFINTVWLFNKDQIRMAVTIGVSHLFER